VLEFFSVKYPQNHSFSFSLGYAFVHFSGVTIQRHSNRQSSNSKINVTQVEVLKAKSIDIVGSIVMHMVKFHIDQVKINQQVLLF